MQLLSPQKTFIDEALFGLRLLLGFVFLYHGVPKLLDTTATIGAFESLGLPGLLGLVVGVLEVVGAVLLILGVATPIASLVLAAIIVSAIGLVHLPEGSIAAGLERDLLILGASIVVFTAGPGRYALNTHSRSETTVSEKAEG
ncbi:DoxX family protein [Halocatena halophila]|uniref:DoxX family protein n=1 Tax=Halocatena halophila TaxID=2814576 RepID=UPI002ED69404